MRVVTVGILCLAAGTALAEPPVIGGSNAPAGKWPDVVAILFPDGSGGADTQECTGTLVAPTVALTAGHCYDTSKGSLRGWWIRIARNTAIDQIRSVER